LDSFDLWQSHESRITMDLKIGDEVEGYKDDGSFWYKGVVKEIISGRTGHIRRYDAPGLLWTIFAKSDGTWGSDGTHGTLKVIDKKETPMKLKVGQRVRGKNDYDEYTGTVFSINEGSTRATIQRDDKKTGTGDEIPGYGSGWGIYKVRDEKGERQFWGSSGTSGDILIILNEEVIMDLKQQFVLGLTKEPQKSFRKAGITNGDDLLTADGQQIFLSWLLHEKHADDFKTQIVDGILEENKRNA
jgi:hypothetical protein